MGLLLIFTGFGFGTGLFLRGDADPDRFSGTVLVAPSAWVEHLKFEKQNGR